MFCAYNCETISISFKFEAPAGYVDCRLSTIDCRLSQRGSCRVLFFDRLAIIWALFCLCLLCANCLNGSGGTLRLQRDRYNLAWGAAVAAATSFASSGWLLMFFFLFFCFSTDFWLVFLFIICFLLFALFDLNYNFM